MTKLTKKTSKPRTKRSSTWLLDLMPNLSNRYSGVKRQDFPPLPGSRENKYTPPARRAPTGSATVKGAPVDPAIISSQLRNPKSKADDTKARAASKNDASAAPPAAKTSNAKPETKAESQPKAAEAKPSNQNSIQQKPSAAAGNPIASQANEGAPSATSTVERDVLNSFRSFANQQRMNVEKARSTKAKADKEVKLTELKKFADSFKLPTPVPVDLISIIAKDPAKQREIQQKAQRDAEEVKKRKAEEAVAKEKKAAASKDPQPAVSTQPPSDNRATRPTAPATTHATTSGGAQGRHQGNNRQSYASQYSQFQGNRSGPQHMPQTGRQGGGLSARIRNLDQQKMHAMPPSQDMRMPPTGPANNADPSFGRRMGVPGHMGGKLNPNSHEFRPGSFAPSFTPNGHPSTTSSPRSNVNNGMEVPTANISVPLVVVTKKRKGVDAKKCVILSHVKTLEPPENKNWNDNDGIPPSYDTPPTWRSVTDDEKPDSTMRLSYNEYFERQPFNPQPTPNPTHAIPHIAHQHQLPFHLQHGAHNMGPRHSPHVPPVQMHGGAQHGPPHAPFNGPDDHRMMHSNSSQSFSSPRISQVPMAAYPPAMNSPAQVPYNQPTMPPFMGPGQPQMNQFGRSFSNNGSYMPQQPGGMGGQMVPPQFMAPQGMVAVPPQMQMYQPGHPQFIPPGTTPPQPMPASNGYPSPGRPAAPMMAPQGSQQGQQMYGLSPGMHYQVPAFPPQQQGQSKYHKNLNGYRNPTNRRDKVNMRGYSNPGPQQFGTSPSQMHQYGPPHRNGNNNYNKGYQGHNQHHGPQGSHPIPTGPQGRNPDGSDETK